MGVGCPSGSQGVDSKVVGKGCNLVPTWRTAWETSLREDSGRTRTAVIGAEL